jgi:uncharacterized phage-like protein YoqJ
MNKRLWITGYRNYELSIFGDKDPKIIVIKRAIKNYLSNLLENGDLNWIITGGQMGSEQFAIEVSNELKKQFPDLKNALMTPFLDFGANWNENNQSRLAINKTAVDFTQSVSNFPYNNPTQLRNYQTFMLNHTDFALLIYDPEQEGKSKYDYLAIKKYQATHPNYHLELINMQQLVDISEEIAEEQRNNFY